MRRDPRYSFNNNKRQIGYALAVIFILLNGLFGRESFVRKLWKTGKINGGSFVISTDDPFVVDSTDMVEILGIMKQNFLPNKGEIIIRTAFGQIAGKNKSELIFCGANVRLDVVKDMVHRYVNVVAGVDDKLIRQSMVDEVMLDLLPKVIVDTVLRSTVGDEFLSCEFKNKNGNPVLQKHIDGMMVEHISCRTIKVLSVMPKVQIFNFEKKTKFGGNYGGHIIGCRDPVYIKYKVLNFAGKKVFSGKTRVFEVGVGGIVPIQVEKTIFGLMDGDGFEVSLSPKTINRVSFYGISKDQDEMMKLVTLKDDKITIIGEVYFAGLKDLSNRSSKRKYV